MKTTVKPRPFFSDCSACGESVQTAYSSLAEIPTENVKLLCEDCQNAGAKARKGSSRQTYYRSCEHRDAPMNTMPVLTDIVVVRVNSRKKEHIRAECGNCSG